MKVEILIENIINLFVVAIVIEAAVMSIFSISSMRDIGSKRPVEATRDGLIVLVAFFLCYSVDILSVFRNTGVKLPRLFDIIISALVLTRLTNFVWTFMSRFKRED